MKIATKISSIPGFQYRLILSDKQEVIAINYYFNGKLVKKAPLKSILPIAQFNLNETIGQFIHGAFK
ncbi:MAG: hypothetical protein ACK5LR_07455 [Mangrovibacterium sp.]